MSAGMTNPQLEPPTIECLAERKQAAAAIREIARKRLAEGSTGVLIAATLAEKIQNFVEKIAEETFQQFFSKADVEASRTKVAFVGVGGTGRCLVAPYSDIDLMILTAEEDSSIEPVVDAIVQSIWDAGFKLGQSFRTVDGALKLAREDSKTATSFVQTRLLWGSSDLLGEFDQKFETQILKRRRRLFVEEALEARLSEFPDGRPTLQELQPNVKTSRGGLRDLQLIGWIGAACYRTLDPTVLQLQRVITPDDANRLRDAEEFLLRIRIRLHLIASGPEDTLTRNLQLVVAEQEGYEDNDTQRGVEQLMQEYFHHTSAVATICDRFVGLNRTESLRSRAMAKLTQRRTLYGLLRSPTTLDVPVGNRAATKSLETVLETYALASERSLQIQPQLSEEIRAASLRFDDELTDRGAQLFREILSRPESLPMILRHMHDTGVLDRVIPQYRPIRALLQFNQYHDFTVDEHTLRAVEVVCSFADGEGPLGRAYARVRNRDVLHLSVFLHDIGKGREEDHSQLGERISREVGKRLRYDDERTDRLSLLVLEHLEMADLAFRRDTSDERLLVEFANRLGSPRTLIKLYLLTAADIMAVGPGIWTPWKAELLAELFERTMVIVSGRNYGGFEEEQIAKLRDQVIAQLPDEHTGSAESWRKLVAKQFDNLPTHYLMRCTPIRIAQDLAIVSTLADDEISVSGLHNEMTGITEYRVILRNSIGGCFQNMCAALTARNCEILAADIATTSDGYVIDGFLVRDTDFINDSATETTIDQQRRTGPQPIPLSRISEMTTLMREVLSGQREASTLFARFERYDAYLEDAELPSGLPTRIRIDNDTSTDRTIIDVFAKDRRGLLYFIAKSIGELNLSIDLAKIATHFDQVVDVFYVTERDGAKLSRERVVEVRTGLSESLKWFDEEGYREYRKN